MAEVKPFRALRYDEAKAGPLEQLVAPPYDVISEPERADYLARSPYNVVHLTLPESDEKAARSFEEWRRQGVLVEESPSFWALEQQYVGPDGVERTRRGIVVSLKAEPYDRDVVLPHERTHREAKEGRLRLVRAVGAQLEPIFLLYDGAPPFEWPARPAEIEVEGARLWRLADDGIGAAFTDLELLIADGHHRYETTVEYAATGGSPWLMAVLVSTEDPGLTIFPTHRIVERIEVPNGGPRIELDDALLELERHPRTAAAAVLYGVTGAAVIHGREGDLDVQLVDSLAPEGVTYTPYVEDAVEVVVCRGAQAALIVRPLEVAEVFARARRGEVLPPKTTYFYPKLLSGLLFHPLD